MDPVSGPLGTRTASSDTEATVVRRELRFLGAAVLVAVTAATSMVAAPTVPDGVPVPADPLRAATNVGVALSCTGTRLDCSSTAAAPLTPGRYTVRTRGTELLGRVESPGPVLEVVV